MPDPIFFVLPDDPTSPSGGNSYNAFLIEALKQKELLGLRALHFNECLQCLRHGLPGVYFVDTLLLPHLDRLLVAKQPVQHVFLVAHQLTGLSSMNHLLDRLSGFLVTSEYSHRVLLGFGVKDKPIFVVPPALCIRPRSGGLPIAPFRGLMVANLIAVKGVLKFLRASAAELSFEDSFEIRVVGRADIEPEYASACLNFIAQHPRLKGRVHFLGSLPLKDMSRLYETSSVFISASQMETFGMAIQEARAFGLPILACNAGNVSSHIKQDEQGQLYSTIDELARGCIELIRDPAKHLLLQRLAWEKRLIENYSWEGAAESFLRQFQIWISSTQREISAYREGPL